MLEIDKKKHFSLFREDIHPDDKYQQFVSKEEELAFIMARINGASGPLMDYFIKNVLKDPEHRRKKLEKHVFRLQTAPGKSEIQKKAAAFYKKTLSGYSGPRK